MTPIQVSKKLNGKKVFENLQNKGQKQTPKFNLNELVQTADTKKVLSKGDITNYSYELYTITGAIHSTNPRYWINNLAEENNQT